MRTWIFTFIFQLVLCVYLTEEVKVKFKRERGSYINGINFYSSTDHFDSIGSTQNYRLQFCIKLNGICEGNTCNQCRCMKQDSTFISYSLGCRNDYFKGIKTSNYLYYMKETKIHYNICALGNANEIFQLLSIQIINHKILLLGYLSNFLQ